MNRRELRCRQCRSWSPDGCDFLFIQGADGVYGRSIALCGWSCLAEYAIERNTPRLLSLRTSPIRSENDREAGR